MADPELDEVLAMIGELVEVQASQQRAINELAETVHALMAALSGGDGGLRVLDGGTADARRALRNNAEQARRQARELRDVSSDIQRGSADLREQAERIAVAQVIDEAAPGP
jgi:hypothetical protein